MAYTVLARKYRSRTFDEVIGQEPIATTLVNAIKSRRIHHAFLFTGTRGVGKTSMARILAKALNCTKHDAPTTTPCCECDVCRAIAEGQDVDVLEIDAASNTGVDNIRELRSNTAYRPARSRYKIYIIDEVHMLSTGAFNALLKTLEEPPEHVKFILATTEVQKVPATIRSRCQCFNFRNIGPEAISKRLREIVQAEGARAEDTVIQRVARLAAGSMRDALSILDQLLSVSAQEVTAQVLDEILPPTHDERIVTLLQHAADGDAPAVLTDFDALAAAGRGLDNFCNDAIEVVRTLMLVRTCGPDASMIDIPAGARDQYVTLSKRFELSHYVQMIAMLEELRRNVRYSGAGRALTEALLARIARMNQWASIEELLGQQPAGSAMTRPAGETVTDAGAAGGATDEKKKHRPPVAEPIAAAETPDARPAGRPTPARDAGPAGAEPLADRLPESAASPHPARSADVVAQRSIPSSAVPAAPRPAPVPVPPPPEPAFDGEEVLEVPEDYHPGEPDNGRQPAPSPRTPTAAERARVEQDPVVRQTLELFDGILINVRPGPVPAASQTE